MRSFLVILFVLGLAPAAVADVKSMGHDFRLLLSNYHMLAAIKVKCPDVTLPTVEPRLTIDKIMQEKVGMDAFVKLMANIQKSDLRKNAYVTVDKLMENLDGCEDVRLGRTLGRIAVAHEEAYARLQAAPALVKPKPTPIPLRKQ